MPKLSYITHDGDRIDLEAAAGATVMQTALERGITGISGDCGGACQCCRSTIWRTRCSIAPPSHGGQTAACRAC
jgi:ferredoxin